ncbi:MAG TPA: glycoside hydrolase family 38 C-terminal domain-containing protein [Candidatus Acidoferrales bacterium]|nr:glycoside hydrolase family 38 C-terminal domain-containing protein [Candidatus Acidoferrales bacterium]
MMKNFFCRVMMILLGLLFISAGNSVQAQGTPPPKTKAAAAVPAKTPADRGVTAAARPDLTKQPTLYVVSYAHLDTEWRWEYPQVIQEYLTKTMRNNFALFDKYPHYIFNFTGANRYMFMKEYNPADYARLKQYVAAGRWFPAGSSIEESDVNSPSAESIFRQILYGNKFFRHEFGKASAEYMLPDCFGFPASLPSILAHAGIKGFSTQKLSAVWQPAPRVGGPDSPEQTPSGIPYNVGLWEGPDGKTIIAALNPGGYGTQVYSDLSKNNTPPSNAGNAGGGYTWDWPDRVNLNGKVTGLYADYHYIGTGDVGGSPNESSVKLLEAIVTKSIASIPPIRSGGRGAQQQPPPQPGPAVRVGDGPLHVISARADEMFLDMKPDQTSRLPRYKGDLELINHSAGSISSQAYHKRWNRQNELLGAAAEEASVAAAWLGGRTYPQDRLTHAWRLVLGGQFHDLMAGTATPKSYEYSWNDDVIAMNQFAGVITSATSAIASSLNTQAQGTPIVVFNPLNIEREDVAEADVSFPGGVPKSIRVLGPDGKEVPAQIVSVKDKAAKILFLAKIPSVGYAVYDVQPSETAIVDAESALKVTDSSLENARYRVQVNSGGDVSSIFDKKLSKELLSAPIRLAIITDNPKQWPAWNMDFDQETAAPRTYIGGAAKIRIAENGPVRVALEISREGEDSTFVQTVSLSAGDAGDRVEFGNVIDWHAKEANLKATFPLTATNKMATYNWDLGTIQRPNEDERQFEVASHQWIDLTDQSGTYGVTILTDDKNASDKPADNTLRLTLLRTPGTRGGYADQGSQDLGHHEFVFGLAGHESDWRQGDTDWQAYRLNQPLIAFETSSHSGSLGKSFSLLKFTTSNLREIPNNRVRLFALKKAEESDEVIVRFVDTSGAAQFHLNVKFAAPVISAREVNGQELPIGPGTVAGGALVTSLSPNQIRSYAVKLGPAPSKVAASISKPVTLPYDISVATHDGRASEGAFDWLPNNQGAPQGKALPAELLPTDIPFAGVHFKLAPAGTGKPDAVTAHGQTINLPEGKFNRLYILAAAIRDQKSTFIIGDKPVDLTIQDWTGFIGQWDNRGWESRQEPIQRPADAPPLPAGAPTMRTVTVFSGQITPGFIKRADVAWFSSHRHDSGGANEAYAYCYLYAYVLDIPAGAKTLTLPDNERIRILAITVSNEPAEVHPLRPLYDTLEHSNP